LADLARNRITKLENANTFIDPRDGHKYKYVKIGDQTWMAENLAFMPHVNPPKKQEYGIWVYDYEGHDVAGAKATENYQKYGCLYDWPTAMGLEQEYLEKEWGGDPENHQGLCPPGWRIPSDKDWMEMEMTMGMPDSVANLSDETRAGGDNHTFGNIQPYPPVGHFLKISSGWFIGGNGDNSSRLSVQPGGTRISYSTKVYFGLGYSTSFWTATDSSWHSYRDVNDIRYSAYTRSLEAKSSNINRQFWDGRSDGRSVRCLKGSKLIPPNFDNPFAGKNLDKGLNQIITEATITPKLINKFEIKIGDMILRDRINFSIDDKTIFLTYRTSSKILALDTETMKKKWIFNLSDQNLGQSMLLSNHSVMCQTKDSLYALSKNDGSVLWQRGGIGSLQYSYIKNEILYTTLKDSLRAINVANGQDFWKISSAGKMFGHPAFAEGIACFPIHNMGTSESDRKYKKILGHRRCRFSCVFPIRRISYAYAL
jgi:uncharacterized protein (TIGR02145 family)